MNQQHIVLIGYNHKLAPVEVREAFALSDSDLDLYWDVILPVEIGICESSVLSTCNRVEFLLIVESNEISNIYKAVLNFWAKVKEQPVTKLKECTYCFTDEAAVEHFFKVSSSLDSMVPGEPQILGQVKAAYKFAINKKKTGSILSKLYHKAFSVAKKVRTETEIAGHAVSVSFAAVELARHIFGDMSCCQALLLGAGETAELSARHLISAGVNKLWVVNRTYSRALCFVNVIGGQAVPYEQLLDVLLEVDIVISSTGSQNYIIHYKDIPPILKQRKNKPIFFIDIAVPRDIDPKLNKLDNIYLYDIDDLKKVVEKNLNLRREEISKGYDIVTIETVNFYNWFNSLYLQPVIVEIIEQGNKIAKEELYKTLKKIGQVDKEFINSLEIMLESVVKKMNHAPIMFLKNQCSVNLKNDVLLVDLIKNILGLNLNKG